MCDPPSQDRSRSAQSSRKQARITEYFSSSNNSRTDKRSRTSHKVIAESSPAKRLKTDEEEIANNQSKSDINLKGSEAMEGDNVSFSLPTETDTILKDSEAAEEDDVSHSRPTETDSVLKDCDAKEGGDVSHSHPVETDINLSGSEATEENYVFRSLSTETNISLRDCDAKEGGYDVLHPHPAETDINLSGSEATEENDVLHSLSMETNISLWDCYAKEGDDVSHMLPTETYFNLSGSEATEENDVLHSLSTETNISLRDSGAKEGDDVSHSLSTETDLKDSEVIGGDNFPRSLSTETDKSVADNVPAVDAGKLPLAEMPIAVVMPLAEMPIAVVMPLAEMPIAVVMPLAEMPIAVVTTPRKVKLRLSLASTNDDRKIGKYMLRPFQEGSDEVAMLTKDYQHLKKKKKRLNSNNDRSPLANDCDDSKVSSSKHTTNGMNLEFYRNKIRSVPDGDFIENILSKWKDDFRKLEQHHGYIQWLFPLKEIGMNNLAPALRDDEATAIREDAVMKERVLRAYKMMLGFYGLLLKDENLGVVEPSDLFQKRMQHLNSSFHNNLRITRILKALGELGFEHLRKPLIIFLIKEAFQRNTLVNCRQSCVSFWIPTLKNKEERESLEKMVKDLEKKELRKPNRFYKFP